MQIAPEIIITFFSAIFLGFVVMPIYYITLDKLNSMIDSKKQPQTVLEFAKVGVGIIVMLIVFILPINIMSIFISNRSLGESCISVHLFTFVISSIISAVILFKTGRVKALWKKQL